MEGFRVFRLRTREMVSHPRRPRCARVGLLQVQEAHGLQGSSRGRERRRGREAKGALAGAHPLISFILFSMI